MSDPQGLTRRRPRTSSTSSGYLSPPKSTAPTSRRNSTSSPNAPTTRRRRSSSKHHDTGPSTVKVLSYVLFIYLAYGLFTRSDETDHLSPSATAGAVFHYGQEYLHDHLPGVDHAGRSMLDASGRASSEGGGGGYSGLRQNSRGVYTLAFPSSGSRSSSHGSSGGSSNLFVLLLTRSFTLLVVYPFIILFNTLSFIFHYVSFGFLLVAWTIYYLTLPISTFLGLLSNAFLVVPLQAVLAVLRFFQPLASLFGGLVGVGAAVGGGLAWIGKKIEGGIYRRADERERKRRMREEQVKWEKEEARLVREREREVQSLNAMNMAYGYPSNAIGIGSSGSRNSSKSGTWGRASRWMTDPYAGYPPHQSSWLPEDDHYFHSHSTLSPAYPAHTRLIYPSYQQNQQHFMPTPSAAVSGIMKKSSLANGGGYGGGGGPAAPLLTPDSTPRPRRKSRISFVEPSFPSTDDEEVDDEDDEDDDELLERRRAAAAAAAVPGPNASPSEFHFHFHGQPEGTTPHRNKRRSTSSAASGMLNPNGSSSSSGATSGTRRSALKGGRASLSLQTAGLTGGGGMSDSSELEQSSGAGGSGGSVVGRASGEGGSRTSAVGNGNGVAVGVRRRKRMLGGGGEVDGDGADD